MKREGSHDDLPDALLRDSGLSDWTAAKMGLHRDLVGDLAKAVRAQGLHLGASSRRIEHDWFLEGGRGEASDVNDPKLAAFYGPAHQRRNPDYDNLLDDWTYVSPEYARDWLARDAEIVEKYHPELLYFDWWLGDPSVRPYRARARHAAVRHPLAGRRCGRLVKDPLRGAARLGCGYTFQQNDDGLHITVPAAARGKYALCFQIHFE